MAFNLNRLRSFLPPLPTWEPKEGEDYDGDNDPDGPSTTGSIDPDAIEQREPITMELAEPAPIGSGPKSNLDLINECDNFPYYQTDPKKFFAHINTYYALYVRGYPETELGYVLPSVAEVFRGLPDWKVEDSDRSLTLISGSNEEERSAIVQATVKAMHATGHFKVLSKWRDELYPVYGPKGELMFSMERSASALFGIVTYGVHMTAYTRNAEGEMKLWVPRRAAEKQTYGGMLDNTVAGGIATGERPFESLVRESAEEASLPEELVRKGAKAAGTVTYFHIRDHRAGGETRLLQPECQFVYDLELSEDVVPKPSDDEVEGFELKTVEETKQALRDGEFKPNCALVLLDFFVRHGILTPETDEGYIEIVARLHRRLDFPTQARMP
ncbi:related to thiamin pyrophosphokinase-related [Lecanosticta acicola]|uniref:Related to thiamin pyrophosphokinase-related n=1 Tax=Lecanosticta acicola TaxID=111012 RepID=A0AAI9EER5_9PEZI|nr:related to thiamin pyrophosphokinase-related [Lecanosticta acicola]